MKNMRIYENGRIKIHRIKKDENKKSNMTANDIMKNNTYNEKILELPTNDIGNTRRFLLFCESNVVYDKTKLMIAFWNGKYWDYNAEDLVMKLVIAVMDKYYEVACDSKGLSKDKQQKLIAHARCSNNLKSVRTIVKTIKYLNAVKEIKCKPYILNTQNGIIDLRNRKLYPHHMDYQCTSICNVKYNPDAKSTRYKKFLKEIFLDNKELIEYVQQMFGYAIAAENTEEKIFFFLGCGGNGKSKLIESISYTIGDYATVIPTSALTKDYKNAGSPTPELVPLINRRVAFSDELKGDCSLNDSAIKQFTGDKEILIRKMREEYITLPIVFTIFVDTNYMPYFKYYDKAVERRVEPFPKKQTQKCFKKRNES